MKKITIFTLGCLALIVSSCSSDSASSAATGSIVGKWEFNKFNVTAGGVTSPEEDYGNNQVGCSKNYIEFLSDGVSNDGKYNPDCTLDLTTGTWSKTGDIVTVSVGDGEESDSFEVVSVSASVLKISATITEEGSTYIAQFSFLKAE